MIAIYVILIIVTWSMGVKRGHGTAGFFLGLIAPIGTIILLLLYPSPVRIVDK